jgi:glycosyltransferase involved in cell wall biosynthesis
MPEGLTPAGINLLYAPPVLSRADRLCGLNRIYQLALGTAADIFHFHDPDLLAVALKLRRQTGKPVIYDIHEYYADSLRQRLWLPAVCRPQLASAFAWYERETVQRLSACVTVNEHMAAEFRQYNPEGAILRNYPLTSQFPYPLPDWDTAAPLTQPRLLYVGGVSAERGLEVMLRALPVIREQFPTAKLTLAGSLFSTGISREFLPLTGRESEGIDYRGRLPYSEIPHLLRDADLALLPLLPTPNYVKALPVKLFEYMAAGLPIVGSAFGHIERILTESGAGLLFTPEDADGLAAQVCRLLTDRELARSCARSGWEAFQTRYSWDREEPELLALYERLL